MATQIFSYIRDWIITVYGMALPACGFRRAACGFRLPVSGYLLSTGDGFPAGSVRFTADGNDCEQYRLK